MSDFVVMPKADYDDILNATREKTKTTAAMLSGEVAAKIRSISGGGAVGEFDLTVSFIDPYNEPMARTGFYRVDDGDARYFDAQKVITLIDEVNSGSTVSLCVLNVGSPSASGENCDVNWYQEYVEVDGMETEIFVFEVSNITADATVTIYEG